VLQIPLGERLDPGTILRNRDGGGNCEVTRFCKTAEAAQPQQAQARRFARGEKGILTVLLACLTNVPKWFLCEEAILPSRNGVFIDAWVIAYTIRYRAQQAAWRPPAKGRKSYDRS
jgi:hypothetical protein